NCETDFVAKNEDFKALVQTIAQAVVENNPADLEVLNDVKVDGTTIETLVKEATATIGEKITIRRFTRLEGSLATYIHNNKIGVLLQTEGTDGVLAKDICLHIASSGCEYVSREEIPQATIDEETRIEMGKEDLANKPENIRAKIVEGRVNKLMSQRCLLEQPFVKNPDQTIQQLIEGKLTITSFSKYTLGEGLEKRSENFAEEVMNQIKN
ncbi:MAG: translation elongation factor Ts, partial [Candidatus Gastranaerophilales bacterium]|nr:translation elongation factor Ts [Candidatus Gastranaerophilales bacterium]